MTIEAPQIHCVPTSAARLWKASFAGQLDPGELLTGTPTVTEIGTSDLTITNVAVSTGALTINGATVAIGEAVQFLASGQTAGRRYRLRVSCDTDATPAQTLVGIVVFDTLSDGT